MVQGVSTGPPTALLWVLCRWTGGAPIYFFLKERCGMTQVLRGNIIQAPRLGELDIREHGYLVLEDGVVQGSMTRCPRPWPPPP